MKILECKIVLEHNETLLDIILDKLILRHIRKEILFRDIETYRKMSIIGKLRTLGLEVDGLVGYFDDIVIHEFDDFSQLLIYLEYLLPIVKSVDVITYADRRIKKVIFEKDEPLLVQNINL